MLAVSTKPTLTVRWAQPDEGKVIQQLCHDNGLEIAEWIDWSKPLGPNWLVAGYATPCACLMVCHGAPIGFVEYLVVRRSLPKRQQAMVVKHLAYASLEVLKHSGSQLVLFYINHAHHQWQQILESRGAVCMNTVNSYLKRI